MRLRISIIIILIGSAVSNHAQDDCGGRTDLETNCKEALAVYRSLRDKKEFVAAYAHWQKVYKECPPKTIERVYSDGVKFVKLQLKTETNEIRKQVLIDSLLLIYDLRMKYFSSTKNRPNNRCRVLGLKATDLIKYRPNEYQTAIEYYSEAIDCLEEESRASYIKNYYQLLYTMYLRMETERMKAEYRRRLINEYPKLQGFVQKGIAKCEWCEEHERFVSSKVFLKEIYEKAKGEE